MRQGKGSDWGRVFKYMRDGADVTERAFVSGARSRSCFVDDREWCGELLDMMGVIDILRGMGETHVSQRNRSTEQLEITPNGSLNSSKC